MKRKLRLYEIFGLELLFCLVLSGCLSSAYAVGESGPLPPCGTAPRPPYPAAVNQLQIQFWREKQLPARWQPPGCSGWQPAGFALLMAASGRFNSADGVQGILQRLAAVSQLAGLRYWSVSRGNWTVLIEQAHALTSADETARRDNFRPDELQIGRDYFYWQHEPGTSGSAIYAFQLRQNTPERIVLTAHNVSEVHRLGFRMLKAGLAETLYVFERLPTGDGRNGLWGYYQLTRMGHGLHEWLPVSDASYANRMISMFRFFAGLPEEALPVWKE